MQVINNTIAKDLKKSTDEANSTEMSLRQERLRLIKCKIQDADSGANVSNVKGGKYAVRAFIVWYGR